MVKVYFKLILLSVFNRRTLYKVLIIFTIGFISRWFVNSFFDINVFLDFYSYISLIYYFLFSCFVIFVHNLIDLFYLVPVVMDVIHSDSLTVNSISNTIPDVSLNVKGLNCSSGNVSVSEIKSVMMKNGIDDGNGVNKGLIPTEVADKHKLVSKGKLNNLRGLNESSHESSLGCKSNVTQAKLGSVSELPTKPVVIDSSDLTDSQRTQNKANLPVVEKCVGNVVGNEVLGDIGINPKDPKVKFKIFRRFKDVSISSKAKIIFISTELKKSVKKDLNSTVEKLKLQKRTLLWFLRGGRDKK